MICCGGPYWEQPEEDSLKVYGKKDLKFLPYWYGLYFSLLKLYKIKT